MQVIVIGSGIAGLTAAIGLRKVGIEVTVCERAPDLREVGAGISLRANANAIRALAARDRAADGRTAGDGTALVKSRHAETDAGISSPSTASSWAAGFPGLDYELATVPQRGLSQIAQCVKVGVEHLRLAHGSNGSHLVREPEGCNWQPVSLLVFNTYKPALHYLFPIIMQHGVSPFSSHHNPILPYPRPPPNPAFFLGWQT
jgi:hypothetical protein